ncbi:MULTISPECIES: histone-like nucleoid-structuring protein, MvaT/MvaU family [Pseudomonas syringae group]|uniref:Transcriptional regulator n=2 Tax=Pseudomonas coronafaciens TaxID=53409 RepID=A0AAE6QK27_9PSED|nr:MULTISPECIES: histone-like nucleoid-structuring protein, MvaT/MvaU family [Pseudomonas syringae group]KOP53849.1 transcriptional regulator [Pseudomonas coronafaciens pv. porri]KOP56193.1 transcriptional regulator [Pseudomonas coronafaciens pv. porri]KPW35036.1 H-NS family protein MvaT [Pseudomonas coronafaciens pv. atropurpurea]KPX29393.1 H-NS family protein MvaT [Pseudomonas coronafaciens pv. garcae]KPY25374.1 H-NS family protein MvaT [Pseudomonas coronafaciens pv. porri]
MSKLAEYRQLERHLADQIAALEAMKGDKGLEQEIEFEAKLRELLGEYSKSLKDVIAILDHPSNSKPGKASGTPVKSTRKARALKVYKNPHTGEVVETKGGNHKTLKEWKAKHGSDTVESWLD